MIKVNKDNIFKAFLAGLFSSITIGALTLLTYKTSLGLFLIASFGSSMVLLYGFPESPFAQPKNIFFGHLLTGFIGILFLNYIPLPIFINIALAVGVGIFFMIIFIAELIRFESYKEFQSVSFSLSKSLVLENEKIQKMFFPQ